MVTIIIILISIVILVILALILAAIYSSKDRGGIHLGVKQDITYESSITDISGIRGEAEVNKALRLLLRKDEYLLTNLLVPINNKYKIEIDSIMVSRKGIFLIEIKSWVGHIEGTSTSLEWNQRYDSGINDRTHINPLNQLDKQYVALSKYLKDKYTLEVSLIIYRATSIDIDASNVYTLREYKEYYRSLEDTTLSIEDINNIVNILKVCVASKEELDKHKVEVEKLHNK